MIIFTLLLVVFANYKVKEKAKNKTFYDINAVPKNKAGLVLGTSKYVAEGEINLYYKYRIEAAVILFKNKKIDCIIVSGDNSTEYYNEPITFKEDLIKRGIPEDKIFLDYAGFRTLDSVVRVKEIFGQESVTIISQKFHNERAIYLAENHKISAVGFNAEDLKGNIGFKTKLREYLAKTKAYLDIIVGVHPKFLGEKIEVC